VHDTTNLETRGIPTLFVASDPFREAADAQSTALGFDAARVFVAHPIQDRTDEEMQALADEAVESILKGIREN
jgi:hypothetical protein|tara:strand:- start:223 stop:441 length:219 start_codon:yes stop_codon:yes gene_type:complete